jgi:hypothetical protein
MMRHLGMLGIIMALIALYGCATDAEVAEERGRGDFWRTCAFVGVFAAFVIGTMISNRNKP